MLIAQRDLNYLEENGTVRTVPVCLYAPMHSGRDWSCEYTIGWPDGIYRNKGYGVDQIQAIYLTLQMIGVRLYFSDYHKTGRLYFEKPGSGYGFPVPHNARDLLVGDDKRFDG